MTKGHSDGGKSPVCGKYGILVHEPNTWCLSPPKSSIYQGGALPYGYPYQELLYNRRPIFAQKPGTPLKSAYFPQILQDYGR